MKRIVKTIISTTVVGIILVVGLFVSEKVFADIVAPYTFSQKVIVTNPDGASADCKDINGTTTSFSVPYGTILWTDNFAGAIDEIVSIKDDGYGCLYNNFSLSRSDIDFADDFFNEEETLRTETDTTRFTELISKYIIDDEVYLYKGPHERYGKNDDEYHLPAGVIVTSTLHDEAWMYIEYGGHSGWIYYHNTLRVSPHVAYIAEDNDSIILSKETEVTFRTKPTKDGEIIASMEVPQLTKLTRLYYFYTGGYSSWNYVVYGQYSGWYFIDMGDFVYEMDEDESVIAIKETAVMSKIDGGEELGKISRNAIAKVLYHYQVPYSMYYVTYNDLSGWVSAEDVGVGSWHTRTFENARAIYDGVNGEKTGDMLPAGDYTVLYVYVDRQQEDEIWWYYVAQNVVSKYSYNALGWVKVEAEEAEAVIEEYMQELEDISEYDNESDDLVKNALLWIIIGAFTLSVTIIVSLAIWKKNRINKKDEPKNEVDDNGAKKEDEIESSSELKNNEGDQSDKNPTDLNGDNNDALHLG